MQLYLRRTQRSGFSSMIFCLDARAELSPEEAYNVQTYKLGKMLVYNSRATEKHLAKMDASLDGSAKGLAKGIMYRALAGMQLQVTINSLTQGQRIECKDLEELMGAEEAIRSACENIRTFLDVAACFDGREEVVDYPGVNAPASLPPTPRVAAPIAAMEAAQTTPMVSNIMRPVAQLENARTKEKTGESRGNEKVLYLVVSIILIGTVLYAIAQVALHSF